MNKEADNEVKKDNPDEATPKPEETKAEEVKAEEKTAQAPAEPAAEPKAEEPKTEETKEEPKAEASSGESQAKPEGQAADAKKGAAGAKKDGPGDPRGRGGRQKQRRGRRPAPTAGDGAPEFMEKVVAINRITKVTKGGKKLSFSALVVVGDAKGRVGYSLDKAGEVAVAIQKAMGTAKKNMIRIPLNGTTIPHQIDGVCSGSLVMLKPAAKGTGVIAAGPVRAVCDAVGIHDILTKCHRSNNPVNVVKATIDGLSRLKAKKKSAPETEPAKKEEETNVAA